jgi:intergrase/recombinase
MGINSPSLVFNRENMVARERFELSSAAPECVNSTVSLNYGKVREVFVAWLKSKCFSLTYSRDVLSYLDRYLVEIRQPIDASLLFSKVEHGRNNLVKSLRVFFNFCEIYGFNEDYLDRLRRALPKAEYGIDLKIPTEDDLVASLGKCQSLPIEYSALYSLLCDSGLRLTEGIHFINEQRNFEQVNGFYRGALAMFRGCKSAYYAHFSEYTAYLISQVENKLREDLVSTYFARMKVVNPKYVRKYVFDKMIELEIPESVADFIQGRVATRIGAKHYLALARQASNFYPKT